MEMARSGRPQQFEGARKRSVVLPGKVYEMAEKRAKETARHIIGWTLADQIRQDLALTYGLVSNAHPFKP